MREVDALIVGGGPAGLSAAVALYEQGVKDILVVEREAQLGGILKQCIHDGFGLTRFQQALSGPEYAQIFIDRVRELGIPCLTNAAVLEITPDKKVTIVTPEGLLEYRARAVLLAMGCRERTRGALAIPGERPAGVFTAGVAQSYINLYNRMPAREVVILGSGDIGLIMARRLTLEGAHVKGVYEILPYPSGLARNIQQCLNDYDIPLHLGHTVIDIHGDARLTGVTVAKVDEHRCPIPGTEEYIPCDTLILSVGLIPENELSRGAGVMLDPHTQGAVVDEYGQTSAPGIFAAGNVLHVHDVVDDVSAEAERQAAAIRKYLEQGALPEAGVTLRAGQGVHHVVPQHITGADEFLLSLRVATPLRNTKITVRDGDRIVAQKTYRRAVPAEMIHFIVKPGIPQTHEWEVSVE